MIYLLTAIGIIVIVGGTYLGMRSVQRNPHRELDRRIPGQVADHPVSRNPILLMYMIIPVAALVLGFLAWVLFGG